MKTLSPTELGKLSRFLLAHQNRFALALVRIPQFDLRAEFAQWTRNFSAEKNRSFRHFDFTGLTPIQVWREIEKGLPPGAIVVLDNLDSGLNDSAGELASLLNRQRERMAQLLPGPALLVLGDLAMDRFLTDAPDLADWYAASFKFERDTLPGIPQMETGHWIPRSSLELIDSRIELIEGQLRTPQPDHTRARMLIEMAQLHLESARVVPTGLFQPRRRNRREGLEASAAAAARAVDLLRPLVEKRASLMDLLVRALSIESRALLELGRRDKASDLDREASALSRRLDIARRKLPISTGTPAPHVFISYSHDSKQHQDQVLALADRLRGDGVDAVIDLYEAAPAEGWMNWILSQIDAADFVLVICTETYKLRLESNKKARVGGEYDEGLLVSQQTSGLSGKIEKFIPVLLHSSDRAFIPDFLRPYGYESIETDAEYERLYRRLTDQRSVRRPATGNGSNPPSERKADLLPDTRWNIPARNEYFSGRDDFLEALHKLTAPVRAIQGLGGLGKTQTAIEFAYRYLGEYTAGFWMTADSRDALVSGFAALGDQKEQDLAKAARGALRWFEENSGWLLILDNVDDWSVVKEWLPAARRGLVLITTRLQSTGIIAKGLDLPKMTPAEGAQFLLRRAKVEKPSQSDRSAARKIAEEVGGLPLALDQAGAFMEEMQASAAEYLKVYGAKLRARRGWASDHDSVTLTFTLAFEKLSEPARDIVRMCAFLAPDAIPEEVLTEGKEPDLPFRQAAAEAARYSLIGRNPANKTFDIHRLVQAVIKDGMSDPVRLKWARRTIDGLNAAFPTVNFENWPACERILPQAEVGAALIAEYSLDSEDSARLLNEAAVYLFERARYSEAEPLYRMAMEIRQKVLGPDDLATAASMNNLAVLYNSQGRYEEAEQLIRRALAARELAQGPEHPDTLNSLNNLAELYRSQGRYAQAEPLYLRAVAAKEKVLGPEHPSTLASLNNLAELYRSQGRYAEAEPLYVRTIEAKERVIGAGHPDTLISLNNLAALYRSEGRYDEAAPLYARALAGMEAVLGLKHPNTITVAKSYADLLRRLGRSGEARAIEARLLRETILTE
jgi:tetratricopeptide (TPR) repeat protein